MLLLTGGLWKLYNDILYRMIKVLEDIEKYIAYAVVVLLPIVFAPFLTSPITLAKEILLVIGILLMVILWTVRMMVKGGTSFAIGRFDLPVFLFAAVFLLSAIIKTPNKMEAFFLPGNVTFVLAGTLLYFLLNQFDKSAKEKLSYSLIISGVLLSLLIVFTTTGILKDKNFNPLGGNVPSIIFLAAIIPILAGFILKQKDWTIRILLGTFALIVILGMGISIKNNLPGAPQATRILDLKNSWEVAAESIKVSPLWGMGPSNYLTAFNKFRPLTYNSSDLWAVRFTTAGNFYLTVVTELGFSGVFALALLIIAVYRHFHIELASIPVILIMFAVFPATPELVVILMVLLSIFSGSEEKELPDTSPAGVPSIIAGVVIIAGVLTVSFFGYKAVFAESKFKAALNALSKNEARTVYDNLREAIKTNPKVDRYHSTLAQVNMALASSTANKKDLTDADRNTISQLIQAAISEGKAVVALNSERSGNWEFLARIYGSITPFAQGADNFAVQTYNQAIALDPINPNLRIALGGTYYALGRLDEAIEAFKLATLAKPDMANAHYNLAIAFREKKEFKKATEEMNIVLSLVGKDSSDYETALKELKNIQELTPPEPVEESAIKPPLELPEEASPPQ